jgi:hypothetical protein
MKRRRNPFNDPDLLKVTRALGWRDGQRPHLSQAWRAAESADDLAEAAAAVAHAVGVLVRADQEMAHAMRAVVRDLWGVELPVALRR